MKRKTILSGRKKTSELAPVSSTNKTKAPTLFDHTSKIQQKLLRLKEEVNEKKKLIANNTQTMATKNFIPIATGSITSSKFKSNNNITTKLSTPVTKIDEELSEFLKNINMEIYEKNFIQNAIDSMEILQQIKQKELEEIGVTKGHALKIIVQMRKMIESRQKMQRKRKELSSAETAQNTNKITSKSSKTNPRLQQNKQSQKSMQKPTTSQPPLQIITQTQAQIGISPEDQPLLPNRRYFCLYCYQVSLTQFCTQNCQELYNKMFEKYEKNLQKAQQLYGGKLQIYRPEKSEQGEEIDQKQFVNDIDFLNQLDNEDNQEKRESQGFDVQRYKEMMDLIYLTTLEVREESAWRAIQENQREKGEKQSEQAMMMKSGTDQQ